MTDLRISEASHEALRARLASPEGKEGMSELVGLIVEAALGVMPPEILQTLETPEGMEAFIAAWPDMVDAYFRGICRVPKSAEVEKPGEKHHE